MEIEKILRNDIWYVFIRFKNNVIENIYFVFLTLKTVNISTFFSVNTNLFYYFYTDRISIQIHFNYILSFSSIFAVFFKYYLKNIFFKYITKIYYNAKFYK